MFKKFMKEVADIEAAGVFTEPIGTREVVEGDEVVGCIADQPYLMALCMAVENLIRDNQDKISQMTEEMEEERQKVRQESSLVFGIVWAGIRLHFGVFDGGMGLRKGWTVVKREIVIDEQSMPEVQILVIPPGVPSAVGRCNNPDCPVHGISRIGRRKIAEA